MLRGLVALFQRDDLGTKDAARLARTERAVDSMERSVASLLELSRSERRVLAADEDIATTVRHAADQITDYWDSDAEIDLEVMPGSDKHGAILIVILQVLVTNAVQHAGATRVVVHIDTSGARVCDDGRGMDAEQLAAIEHNQVPDGRLGWSIVHRICERYDWQPRVRSGCSGTEVTIEIDANAASPDAN
mgnify:CR=1 FL=1